MDYLTAFVLYFAPAKVKAAKKFRGISFQSPQSTDELVNICGASIPATYSDSFVPFKVTNDVSKNIKVTDCGMHSVFVFDYYGKPSVPDELKTLTVEQKSVGIVCVSSDRGFAIAATGPRIAYLSTLLQAFKSKDIVLGGKLGDDCKTTHNFKLFIASTFSQIQVEESRDFYKGQVIKRGRLEAAMEAAKIHQLQQRLRTSNKNWKKMSFDLNNRGRLLIIVEPVNHNKYKAGTYTTTDLEAWLTDSGPIMK